MLPFGLKWPTSPPLSPTATPNWHWLHRSPALYPSQFQFSFPHSRVFSHFRSSAANSNGTAGDNCLRWDASGLRLWKLRNGHLRPNFFYPLKLLNTQILNPDPAERSRAPASISFKSACKIVGGGKAAKAYLYHLVPTLVTIVQVRSRRRTRPTRPPLPSEPAPRRPPLPPEQAPRLAPTQAAATSARSRRCDAAAPCCFVGQRWETDTRAAENQKNKRLRFCLDSNFKIPIFL
jgi:hypothetical protein